MRRGIWLGAAILVVVAAAIPVWRALDDGAERSQAALTESTKPALDCSRATVRGCPELNQALAALDVELAGDRRAAEIERFQALIKESSYYKAGVIGDLSQEVQFELQQALQRQQQLLATLTNVSKAYAEVQQALVNNLKG